jgi:hypothetical protein
MRPRMARPVTDLPDPDSPTRPSTSPRCTSKDTPFTAVTRPSRVENVTARSRTDRMGREDPLTLIAPTSD